MSFPCPAFIHRPSCEAGAGSILLFQEAPWPMEAQVNLKLSRERNTMLSWAITFLVIAIIAAVLGFGGIAGTAAGIAKVLFFVFLVLFVISLFFGRGRAV